MTSIDFKWRKKLGYIRFMYLDVSTPTTYSLPLNTNRACFERHKWKHRLSQCLCHNFHSFSHIFLPSSTSLILLLTQLHNWLDNWKKTGKILSTHVITPELHGNMPIHYKNIASSSMVIVWGTRKYQWVIYMKQHMVRLSK